MSRTILTLKDYLSDIGVSGKTSIGINSHAESQQSCTSLENADKDDPTDFMELEFDNWTGIMRNHVHYDCNPESSILLSFHETIKRSRYTSSQSRASPTTWLHIHSKRPVRGATTWQCSTVCNRCCSPLSDTLCPPSNPVMPTCRSRSPRGQHIPTAAVRLITADHRGFKSTN
jgi:hypothetical protein